MLVFIDESGDPGLKIEKGASRFFIVAALIFKKTEEARKVEKKIIAYRKKKKISPKYEFKFNKTRKDYIVGFLKEINSSEFEIRYLVLDKRVLKESMIGSLRLGYAFYSHFLRLLLLDDLNLKHIRLVIDGTMKRELRKSFGVYLRKNRNSLFKIKLKVMNSKNDNLIQLVDVISGSIRRSYEKEKGDSKTYVSYIKDKITIVKRVNEDDLVPILK